MTFKKSIISILTFFVFATTFAQEPIITKKDSTVVSSWMFGIGYNFIDDSGDVFDAVLDISESWHALPYPSRISIGKYFRNGLGIEAIGAYMKYDVGKRVDRLNITEDTDFWSFDARLSYDLNKIIGETGWFDPYIGVGAGYTDANRLTRGTFNGVIGFRTWFNDNIGLDFNSSGKWSIDGTATNYLQHVVGVVFRFSKKKDLTEQGKEKLALINELEQEKIRVNDSIQLAEKIKQEQQLVEERKEKEILVQIRKKKEEAKRREIDEIKKEISALEKLYFRFNSSELSTTSKTVLSRLVGILNKYPELTVEITSHTDSRGSAKYNKDLSVRRFKSTVDYLIENNITPDRIFGNGYGEEKLTNECDDATICSEKKHRENRRSEIKVIIN